MFFLLFALPSFLISQTPAQTIRGKITDADTGQPLPGATVLLSNTEMGSVTDTTGRYRLPEVPVGRYQLEVRYVGYENLLLPEVLVESGKEVVLNIELKESPARLQEVEVTASRSDIRVPHPVSVKALTVEQTRRFPATFYDPARLAYLFPGTVNDNDQANGLAIRGNSPNSLIWRLEGVDIVNPNHTPNAGTFSDRITRNGGGVNILSAQMLGTSHFYTGAFPAQYGNVLSGVLDMRLRPGNNEKHEKTFQAGLIGLDVAAEGPLSKNKNASYLANYRYSTVGLLTSMGVDFGDEQINFQDLSFNLTFPTQSGGKFTLFGIGGLSENLFEAERDSTVWEFEKDRFDITFRSKMGALGASFTQPFGENTAWHTVVAASAISSERTGERLNNGYEALLVEEDELTEAKYALHSWINRKWGAAGTLRLGVQATQQAFSIRSVAAIEDTLARGDGDGLLLQPYASWSLSVAPGLQLNAGLHYLYFGFNHTSAVEPRLSMEYQLSNRQRLSLAYGLHSQLQPLQLYFAETGESQQNEPLGFTRAHHVVIGYEQDVSRITTLSVEAFYQSLFDVPIAANASNSFSALNLLEGFVTQELANEGTGENYGIELSLQRYLADGFFFLANGTYFQSKYTGSDGIQRDTRYNSNYIFNLTGGKEWSKRKKEGRLVVWGANLRVAYIGGFRETPIDVEASAKEGKTVYNTEQAYSIQQPGFFRTDLRVYRKWNREKFNSTLALDIQNLTNAENVAFSYYDVQQGQVVEKFQLGIIPILTYRIEF